MRTPWATPTILPPSLPKLTETVCVLPPLFCSLDRLTSLPDIVWSLTSIASLKDLALPGFFVTEGQLNFLMEGIPRAVAEMYACAKHLGYEVAWLTNERCLLTPYRQKILRGALTNGIEWVFIILYLKDDEDGATYRHSRTIRVSHHTQTVGPTIVDRPGPDIIAGILSYWVGPMLPIMLKCMCILTLNRCSIAVRTLAKMTGSNLLARMGDCP